MMLLAALVAGLPLVCTCNTGHHDYLVEAGGGWLGVPAPVLDEVFGEEGMAPVVEPEVLAQTLAVALQPEARRVLIGQAMAKGSSDWGTWSAVEAVWDGQLLEWIKETP